MIQQRAAPALSFSMVSLKSLQTFTSASGSTVAAGLGTRCTVLQEGTWNPQTCADESRWEGPLETDSSLLLIHHQALPPSHAFLLMGRCIPPNVSSGSPEYICARHMRSRDNLTRKCTREALFTDSSARHFLC